MRTFLMAMMMLVTSGCVAPTTAMVECPAKGCAKLDPPTWAEAALLAHAELDLQCSRARLDVKKSDDWTSWVLGCGRAARYAFIGQRYGGSRWILDSPVIGARHE